MNTDEITRNGMIEAVVGCLLPGADQSRSRILRKVLNSLTGDQLAHVVKAVDVAVRDARTSVMRDAIESRNMMMVEAASRWGKIIDLSALEGALNRQFGYGDRMYDVYSPVFEAHIEAYATYHDHCGKCSPSDRDLDYSALEDSDIVSPVLEAHYVDYLQDYELMDIVEDNPELVSTFVKFAAERKGIDDELLQELISSKGNALQDGLL